MAIEKLLEFAKDGQKNTDDLNLTDGFPVSKKPARQWFNWLFNSLTSKVNEIIDAEFIPKAEIVDNLTTNDATKPVSAKQAKVLQDNKLDKTDLKDASTTQKGVVQLNNTLTSTSTTEALTAAQGMVLNSKMYGMGRDWVNETANRLIGTTYINTKAYPIDIIVLVGYQGSITLNATLNDKVVPVFAAYNASAERVAILTIDPQERYKINNGSLLSWWEKK